MEFWHSAKPHSVGTIVEIISVSGPVANSAFALRDIPTARGSIASVSILSVLGNNVDHTIDSVRSPDRSARAANHFDPLDIFQQYVLNIPINPREKRSVDAAAINQYQYRLGECISKAAYGDRPGIGIDTRYLNARYKP